MDESRPTSLTSQVYFVELAERVGQSGPLGEVVRLLAEGNLSPAEFRALCHQHGLGREHWFRAQILDLVIGYVQEALRSGTLSSAQLSDIRALSICLAISEREFIDRRPAEVAAILGEQLERILEDSTIDDAEELYQVDL